MPSPARAERRTPDPRAGLMPAATAPRAAPPSHRGGAESRRTIGIRPQPPNRTTGAERVIAWSRETVRLMSTGPKALFASGESPPADYDRAPTYESMIREQDVHVPMRDGVKLCVDVYRPDTGEKLPALLAFAIYN